MLRKQIVPRPPTKPAGLEGEIPVTEVATVQVTSEQESHPIDSVFDNRRRGPAEQTLTLVFDNPQAIRVVGVEVEEPSVSRTQELSVSISPDGGRTYRELVRQESAFSPPGPTFEREVWSIAADGVTHLRIDFKPDEGGRIGQATLTSLSLA